MQVAFVNDGDFTVPKQNGATSFRFPFYDKGDATSFEATVTMRVAEPYYVRGVPMSTRNFAPNGVSTTCYLVGETDAQSVGQGLLESKLTYASLPVSRDEYSAITWPYQVLFVNSDQGTASIIEVQMNLGCRIHYSYSLTLPAATSNPTVQVFNTDGDNPTLIFKFGGFGSYIPATEILARGTEPGIYKCKIYVLKSTYIIPPPYTS